jgi:hypothetical protein
VPGSSVEITVPLVDGCARRCVTIATVAVFAAGEALGVGVATGDGVGVTSVEGMGVGIATLRLGCGAVVILVPSDVADRPPSARVTSVSPAEASVITASPMKI